MAERSLDFSFFFFFFTYPFNFTLDWMFKAYFVFMRLQMLQFSSVTSFRTSNNRLSRLYESIKSEWDKMYILINSKTCRLNFFKGICEFSRNIICGFIYVFTMSEWKWTKLHIYSWLFTTFRKDIRTRHFEYLFSEFTKISIMKRI